MNCIQQKNVDSFVTALLEQSSNGGRTAIEIKSKEVIDGKDSVELRLTVGMVGDENTAAELYCRHFRQVFFGPRGRVTCRTVGKCGEINSVKIVGFTESVWG